MALSRARMRAYKRIERARKRGDLLPLVSNQVKADLFDIMTADERKSRLSSVAQLEINAPVSAGHIVSAIKELNLMEHVYDERPQTVGVVNFVFILPDGSKIVPGQMVKQLDCQSVNNEAE